MAQGSQEQARGSGKALNRLPRLQPPWALYKLGASLMDGAQAIRNEEALIQFRDGLIIALLALWPIRRRSLAALTVDRHVTRYNGHIAMHLFPEDTKCKRPESFTVPFGLISHFERYLDAVRPHLLKEPSCLGLWISGRGSTLSGDGIYQMFTARTAKAFGVPMALHDVRRSAATFIAIEAPEKLGLIPGILSHTDPAISERHYNLAGGAAASRRFIQVINSASRP